MWGRVLLTCLKNVFMYGGMGRLKENVCDQFIFKEWNVLPVLKTTIKLPNFSETLASEKLKSYLVQFYRLYFVFWIFFLNICKCDQVVGHSSTYLISWLLSWV